MCGIVGVVDLRGQGRVPSSDVVDRMTDALARRGPDGRGVWRAHNAALGHRRLAVLDTTDAAAQPMVGHGVALVFNGEIYNYKQLRRELEQLGHTFASTGDTAVLLAAWRAWGPALVHKLNGIFALAIVDERERRVFLARDHIGVKPLFFAVHHGVLRFGSEIKALLADPAVPRIPDPRALDCFLTHGYAPQPLSPFLGIEQLEPASTWSAQIGGGAPVIERYWTPRASERRISMDRALDELGARLTASVSAQMVSDVPLGAFLSSGLDSASVVAEMVRLSSEPVRTFSIGFTQASFDERAGAAHTAQVLGAKHHAEVVELD
ncbi:MAG TPA: asparagine synthase (glutamine-hydrolyzing), partial [Myxococcota bacterium]